MAFGDEKGFGANTYFTKLDVEREARVFGEFQRRIIPDVSGLISEARLPENDDERDAYYHLYATVAAQDLFIAQSTALGLGVTDDADLQSLITRQIGDDGRHASYFRESIEFVTGRDPIKDIEANLRAHWELIGDLPRQGFLGWLAFEFDYEFYAVPEIINAAVATVGDPRLSHAGEGIYADEAFHRHFLSAWWRRHLSQQSVEKQRELIGKLLEYDRTYRALKADYYKGVITKMHRLGGWPWDVVKEITLNWHREVRDYLLPQSAHALRSFTDGVASEDAQAQ
jgi:hypothetical protein